MSNGPDAPRALGARHGVAIVLAAAIVAWPIIGWTGAAVATTSTAVTATASPSARDTKYYIVGPPVNGQQEYLFDIAARTLGDGNRYLEIFALNQGRPQPGGGRLTDPTVLKQGWILVLPYDASGASVHVGLLPAVEEPVNATVEPTSAPGPSAEEGSAGSPLVALLGGALAAAVFLLALVGLVLRGARTKVDRLAEPVTPPRSRPAKPAVSTDSIGTATTPWPTTEPARIAEPAPTPEPAPIPEPAPRPTSAPTLASGLGRPQPVARRTLDPVPPSRPEPAREREPVRPRSGTVDPLPTSDRRRRSPLDAPVRHGTDLVTVRIGRDGLSERELASLEASACLWLAPLEEPTGTSMTAYVGGGPAGSLYLRLPSAPDFVSITGDPDAGRRLARAIGEQVASAGHPVTEVGGDGPWPFGVRRLNRLPADGGPPLEATGLVVYHHPPATDAHVLRGLGNRLLVVGGGPPALWSIDVWPAD